jgi:hypothetical protein
MFMHVQCIFSCKSLCFIVVTVLDIDSIGDEDVIKHEGRSRSFPHVAGNWATYVFVPCKVTHRLVDLLLCTFIM